MTEKKGTPSKVVPVKVESDVNVKGIGVRTSVNKHFLSRMAQKLQAELHSQFLTGTDSDSKYRHGFSNAGTRQEIYDFVVAFVAMFETGLDLKTAGQQSCKNNPDVQRYTAPILANCDKFQFREHVVQSIRKEVAQCVAVMHLMGNPDYASLFTVDVHDSKALEDAIHETVHSFLLRHFRSIASNYRDGIQGLAERDFTPRPIGSRVLMVPDTTLERLMQKMTFNDTV